VRELRSMSDDNEMVGPFTRKDLRDKLSEAYGYGYAEGANHYGQLAEKYWADAHIDEIVADAPKPASAIPTPTPRLDRIVEGVVLSDNLAPLTASAKKEHPLNQDYPISLIGVDAHGCSPIDGAFLGTQTVAYAGAVKEANRLMSEGGWKRIYILVPSDFCCEMRDGKPTMVKHHLGEE
jgi:hypothetical protein